MCAEVWTRPERRVSSGASKPATHGRFKTSHPFRVVTVVNSTIINGVRVIFSAAYFCQV
jgi:hypothetical protein